MDIQWTIYIFLSACVGRILSFNTRPIIGILTQESGDGKMSPYGESYVQAAYVRFIQSGGARVVPIKMFQSDRYYLEMFSYINGFFMPGGGANLTTSGYAKAGKIMFDLALKSPGQLVSDVTCYIRACKSRHVMREISRDSFQFRANLKGDYFPIWGTCLGLQYLVRLVSGKSMFSLVDARNYPVPLEFGPEIKKTRLYQEARPHIIRSLQRDNVTNANHKFAVLYQDFAEDESLMNFFRIVSTNTDRKGTKFISSIEARDFPIWGVQFHPEKTSFVWEKKFRFLHTIEAVEVSQFFGNFFVDQARRNDHSYPSTEMELNEVIQNYQPVYPKMFYPFEQVYAFNFTTDRIELD